LAPNGVFGDGLCFFIPILIAAAIADLEGDVSATRNIAQICVLPERDPKAAFCEAADLAEIAASLVLRVGHWGFSSISFIWVYLADAPTFCGWHYFTQTGADFDPIYDCRS
jgi:hypothetical protein